MRMYETFCSVCKKYQFLAALICPKCGTECRHVYTYSERETKSIRKAD
jgi:hypothetical protein